MLESIESKRDVVEAFPSGNVSLVTEPGDDSDPSGEVEGREF